MRELYPHTANAELARRFGRSAKAVALFAKKLRLRKSYDFLASRCRFLHGHQTWNKGKPWSPQGSAATRFKKGHRGARQRPVGFERIERDGIVVKVAEPSVWIPRPRLAWEKHFGRIPERMIVRLRDGDKFNTSPDNLMLVSRAENARLNAAIRRPRKRRTSAWQMAISATLRVAI